MNARDSAPDAQLPPKGSPLGLRSWLREMRQAAEWSVNPPPFPEGPLPGGDGRTVLLLPGFLAGDWTLGRLAGFLSLQGYVPEYSGVPFNAGPMRLLIEQFEKRLHGLVEQRGPVAVIGVSLGGVFARHLALSHPDCVSHVVTLCAPVRFPVTTPLAMFVKALAPLHAPEFRAARDAVSAPLPVPATIVYTEDDGVLDWRQCLPEPGPDQTLVRVRGTHIAIGTNPEAQAVIAHGLARGRVSARGEQ